MTLPSPSTLLGIEGFDSWYKGQDELVTQSVNWYHSPKRFLGLSVPTGAGKSINALLLHRLTGARTVILTATKGLQNQYIQDALALGAVNMIGQNNFPCPLVPGLKADEGPCHDGVGCAVKDSCPYRVRLKEAQGSKLVITNYAYWLAQTNFALGLGEVDLLICDEAHQAFGAMESYLTIFLSKLDIEPTGIQFPKSADHWGVWRSWAEVALPLVQESMSGIEADIKKHRSQNQQVPHHVSRAYRVAKGVAAKLERLSSVGEDWVIQKTYHGYRFVPKWVSKYSEHLFHKVPKVVLMSAILSGRTVDYLGVPSGDEREWIEMSSHFPPENTPIWHIPTARINFRTDDYGNAMWASRIDQIIQRRLDRKGIVFTVSYNRARLLLSRSRFKNIMLTHSTGDVVQVVDQFKRMDPPAVLVSPTVTTGWDFPGLDYIIVGKIPYPDTRDPVTKARSEEDKEWTSYLAMDTFVQETGRGTRCLSWDTQILTYDGWKGPEDVKKGDLVYSLSQHSLRLGSVRTGGLEPSVVKDVHIWDTDKSMVSITGKSLDVLVTPDHDLVIQLCNEARNLRYKFNNWAVQCLKVKNLGIKKSGLVKRRADSLPVRFRVLVAGHCQRDRRGTLANKRMAERDKWLFLLGLVISDGSILQSGNRVPLRQSTSKSDVCSAIDAVLRDLDISFTRHTANTLGSTMSVNGSKEYRRNGDTVTWSICGFGATRIKKLFNGESWRRESESRAFRRSYPLTKVEDKTIPMWVLQQCRKRELRALLDGMMAGDGTWAMYPLRGTYYTSNKDLADRLQYLLVLSDYRSHIRLRRGSSYEVQFSDNQFVDIPVSNVKVVPYSGKTWCVSTDLGTIVTRRNRCTAIVGNSAEDKCEVLVVDDAFLWFYWKYKDFAPKWFQERVLGSLETVPDPLV